MNSTKLFCGLLLTGTLGIGCKPRVPAIPDAVAEKNPDGTTTVTHRHLEVALAAPEKTNVAGTPTEMELSWKFGGGFEYLKVRASDPHTPKTADELKLDLELRGSSLRVLESKETEDGGYSVTFTYRNKSFDLIGGHYAVRSVGAKKVVCSYTSRRTNSVREAKSICDSIQPYEAPAVTAKAPAGKL
jgi:hypothetical protein